MFDPDILQRWQAGTLTPSEASALVDQIAPLVERDPRYRIARELAPRDRFNAPTGAATARGLILDVEATGLDRANDQIVELGVLSFEFEPATARILRVVEVLDELEDPGCPIPPAAIKVHGISDEMVQGRRINDETVRRLAQDASIIIAHNAEYDRAMVERRFDCFADRHWACSAREVPWREHGFASNALGHLALASGLFFGAHRAVMDCRAVLEILSRPFPGPLKSEIAGSTSETAPPDDESGRSALAWLLRSSGRLEHKLWALQAPFDRKDHLKGRGYRWHSGDDGQPKAWAITLVAEANRLQDELDWLRNQVYKAPIRLRLDTLDARSRYTERNSVSETIMLS
jgi:DNA polymerase-3 subunit epsilon